MFGLDTPETNAFYWGKYYGKKNNNQFNQNKPKQFRYEIVNPKDSRYHQIVQNLITADKSIVISTSWDLPFENQGIIELQDGEKLLINNMKDLVEDFEAQVNMLVKMQHKTTYMELT